MRKKSILLIVLYVFLLLCFNSCKAPASPEKIRNVILSILSNDNPIFFYFNSLTGYFNAEVTITVSESGGVSCNITGIDVSFIYNNTSYETQNLSGQYLNAYGSFNFIVTLKTEYIFDAIRIVVRGVDANGKSVSKTASFALEKLPRISGTYRGEIAGTQFGWLPFTSYLTLKITQNQKKFSGTWITDFGTSGTLEGEFNFEKEWKWNFEMDARQTNPGAGLYECIGSIIDWGYTMISDFVGSSGAYGKIDATFSVTRRASNNLMPQIIR